MQRRECCKRARSCLAKSLWRLCVARVTWNRKRATFGAEVLVITDSTIEIRPGDPAKKPEASFKVSFAGDQIAELRGDGILLDSFTLEPEILSNDLSSKGRKTRATELRRDTAGDGPRHSRHRRSPLLRALGR